MRDPDAEPLLAQLPDDERFETWHLTLPSHRLVGHGAGGVDLLRSMRLTRPVGRLVARAPETLLDRVYELVARHRCRLGRLVPDGPGPRRFP
jgi:hypothetical protein